MARIIVASPADADTADIIAYLAANAGYNVAGQYIVSFEKLYDRLAGHPGSGAPRPALGPRVRNGIVSPYISRDFALDPQDLARLLVSRANAGDVEGMVALYEPDAVLACGDGRIAVGTDAIRKFYTDLLATGRTFDLGKQRPAMLRGNLALTSTRLPNGVVTAEVAR
jgi:plasmid stabilization system protein ParE